MSTHAPTATHDIAKLEQEIKGLQTSLRRLADDKHMQKLLTIIRRPPPGWTTLAEFALVTSVVRSARSQMEQLATLQEDLVKGADMDGHG